MADWLAQLSERLDQLPAAGLAAPPEPTLEPLLEPLLGPLLGLAEAPLAVVPRTDAAAAEPIVCF